MEDQEEFDEEDMAEAEKVYEDEDEEMQEKRREGREPARLKQMSDQSSGDHRGLLRRDVAINTLKKSKRLRSKQCV